MLIRHRIAGLVLGSVTVVGLLAGTTWVGLEAVQQRFKTYESVVARTETVQNVKEDFDDLRRSALQYRLAPSPERARAIDAELAEIGRVKAAFRAQVAGTWLETKALDAVARIDTYDKVVDDAMARSSADARRAAFGRLDTLGPDISETFDAIEQDLVARQAALAPKLFREARQIEAIALAGGILGVMVTALGGLFLARSVSRPLTRARRSIAGITEGSLTDRVPDTGRPDEIGDIARGLASLRTSVSEAHTAAQILRNLPTAVLTTDTAGTIQTANPEAADLGAKVGVADPANACVTEFVEPDAHHELTMACRRANDETIRIQAGKDGHAFDLDVTALTDRDGVSRTRVIVVTDKTELRRLADRFQDKARSVADATSALADSLTQNADELRENATAATDLAQRATKAADTAVESVNAVASASQEMGQSIRDVSEQVARASAKATEARQGTDNANQAMTRLRESAAHIGEILSFIQDIAKKTNLLAMNATIEAVRAGSVGSGFGVVADEVKRLATQTGEATDDIAGRVASIQAEVNNAVANVGNIAETVRALDEISSAVASAAEEQTAATSDIAENAQVAADRTREVAAAVSRSHAVTMESAEKLQAVHTVSAQAQTNTSSLRADLGRFVTDVREAA